MKSKFKIGDIVEMEDSFHFNECRQTRSIGKIMAIHIHRKPDWMRNDSSTISYSIAGFSIRPDEDQLKLAKNY